VRRAVLLSSCLLACSPEAPPAQGPAPPAKRVDAATSAADAALDGETADAAPPPPPPRSAFVGRLDMSLLFTDETAHLEDVARELAGAQSVTPVRVLSRDGQAKLEALAAAGRVHEGGPVCAQRPSVNRVVEANVGGYGVALRFRYGGDGTSSVAVEVRDPPGDGAFAFWAHYDEWTPVVRVAADVPVGASPSTIESALRAAHASAFDAAKREEPAPPVHWVKPAAGHVVANVRLAGAGWAAVPTAEELGKERAVLDKCAPKGDESARGAVTVSVDASGRVARCEPSLDNVVSASLSDCSCRALGAHAFASGPADRRLRIEVFYLRRVQPAPGQASAPRKTVAANAMVDPMPPGDWDMYDAAWLAYSPRVAACFHPLPKRRDDRLSVDLDLDDAGTLTHVTVREADWMDAVQKSCVEGAFKSAGLPCPILDDERHMSLDILVER
jgi:hypothetical protein